jgi:hypothetical protein
MWWSHEREMTMSLAVQRLRMRLLMGAAKRTPSKEWGTSSLRSSDPTTVRTMALLRRHTQFRRRLAVPLAQEKKHMRNPMLNESLQRTAGLRFSQFVAQWPAAAEFKCWATVV